jgi:hypothetical protein
MSNEFLTLEEIKKAFRKVHLDENYNFLEEDLSKLANAFVAAAEPAIAEAERKKCVTFVRSLNTQVAQALADFKGKV